MAQSQVLHQLDKNHLLEVLKSPFLQASELEILHAVLKWGENELVRRMEDRGNTYFFWFYIIYIYKFIFCRTQYSESHSAFGGSKRCEEARFK